MRALVAVLILAKLAYLYRPLGLYAAPFNSDMAIPVLMARDGWRGVESLYFYGQDRIGAWPYLIAALEPRLLYASMVGVLGLGLWGLARARDVHASAAAAGVFVAAWLTAGHPLAQAFFDPCQPHLPALACVALYVAVRPKSRVLAAVAATLAVWSYRPAALLLLLIPGGFPWEVLVAALAEESLRRLVPAGARATPVAVDWGHFAENVAAVWGQARDHGVAALAALWAGLAWMGRDRAKLTGSLAAMAAGSLVILIASTWPRVNGYPPRYLAFAFALLALAATLAADAAWSAGAAVSRGAALCLAVAVLMVALPGAAPVPDTGLIGGVAIRELTGTYVYLDSPRRGPLVAARWLLEQVPAHAWLAAAILGVGWLARRRRLVALLAASLLALALARLHVYRGAHATLAPGSTSQLPALALDLLVLGAALAIARRAPALPRLPAWPLVLLALALPVPTARHPVSDALAREAALLEAAHPGAVITGSYWDTYVFAGLQHAHPLVSVPEETAWQRTPWTRAALAAADEILVAGPSAAPPGFAKVRDVTPRVSLHRRLRPTP